MAGNQQITRVDQASKPREGMANAAIVNPCLGVEWQNVKVKAKGIELLSVSFHLRRMRDAETEFRIRDRGYAEPVPRPLQMPSLPAKGPPHVGEGQGGHPARFKAEYRRRFQTGRRQLDHRALRRDRTGFLRGSPRPRNPKQHRRQPACQCCGDLASTACVHLALKQFRAAAPCTMLFSARHFVVAS